MGTYMVQPGDTMSGIASMFGVSLAALVAANPQIANPDLIYPGQVINIPGGGGPYRPPWRYPRRR
ncbi:MAG TPA: LysM domain-containing protein [Spirochaetia bacterium]|nr:LysM domain-containing protein [Spirochaetia bacterium]